MAQDPGFDSSHDFDMVTIYDSMTVDAEMEANMIHGILEANGIPSTLVRPDPYPPLGYHILVPQARVEEARRAIAEAQAAGPAAADEAEAESEG
jgi:hypothetical protein